MRPKVEKVKVIEIEKLACASVFAAWAISVFSFYCLIISFIAAELLVIYRGAR
jgi:hypothetical protein